MKKSKWNIWVKVRSALRDIYRYSPMRREAIKAVTMEGGHPVYRKWFKCQICELAYPIELADCDHIEPCGALLTQDDLPMFFDRLMNGKVRVIDKMCHKKITAAQRKKKK